MSGASACAGRLETTQDTDVSAISERKTGHIRAIRSLRVRDSGLEILRRAA